MPGAAKRSAFTNWFVFHNSLRDLLIIPIVQMGTFLQEVRIPGDSRKVRSMCLALFWGWGWGRGGSMQGAVPGRQRPVGQHFKKAGIL